MPVTRVCFVCLGNICRSPMAEGVFKHLVRQAELEHQYEVSSAGVGPWHVGESPDARAQATARGHGIDLTCVAQQIRARDFARYDWLLALDSDVADSLRRLAPTPADRAKVHLLREFDPQRPAHAREADLDVPDPYYGGPEGFEHGFEMIERSCRGLLAALQALA